jgi:MFS family permease
MVGWIAPVLLCVMRFGQGFGLGGEWGGAALLAIENAPRGWEARFGSAPQAGVPVGFFFANAMFLILGLTMTDRQFADWGWRVPFAASAVLVALGLWMRRRIGETPEFRAMLERGAPAAVPLARVLRDHFGAVIAGSAGVIVVFATFYLATAWALAELTGPLGHPQGTVLGIQLVANLTMTAGIFFSAWLADRTRPATAISIGSLGVLVMGAVFGLGLLSGSLALAGLTLCTTMFFMGMTNGPLGSWLTSLYPVRLRYSGVSFAFNFGGILGGAATPILAQLLSGAGLGVYTGLLLSVTAVLSLLGLQLAKPADPMG